MKAASAEKQADLFFDADTEQPKTEPVMRRAPGNQATHKQATKQLWLCLRFPDLALQVFSEYESDVPFAVLTLKNNRQSIYACSESAADAGVESGMSFGAAQALCPQLLALPRDEKVETRRLQWLARWCNRFASLISVSSPDTIFLEISGSLKLFGGIKSLHRSIRVGLQVHGHRCRSAISPTPRSAYWLSQVHDKCVISDQDKIASAIGPLPLSVLCENPKLRQRLHAIGARTIADVARLPRAGLAQRYGRQLLTHLDQAYGKKPEPLPCIQLPQRFQADVDLVMASENSKHIAQAADHGLDQLQHYLKVRDLAVNRYSCILFHDRHPATTIEIGMRMVTREKAQLNTLLHSRLQHLSLAAPVLALRIEARQLLPFSHIGQDFFNRSADAQAWQSLLDQWQARLGSHSIIHLSTQNDHRPERAHKTHAASSNNRLVNNKPRPLYLLDAPQALHTQNKRPWRNGPLEFLTGPERIEQGWWDNNDVSRDYYQVQDATQQRLWIFQDRRELGWFLHGFFS